MTFPEEQPKSLAKLIGVVKDFLGGSSEDRIPHHDQVQQECLLIFLDKHEKILKNLEFSKSNLSKFVNDIYHIYNQLQSHCLSKNDSPSDSRRAVHLLPMVRTYIINVGIRTMNSL